MLLKTCSVCQWLLFSSFLALLLQQQENYGVNTTATLANAGRAARDSDEENTKPTSAPSKTTSTCPIDYWPTQLDTMNSYVDEVVWPCDDFYEYACGNWRAPYLLRALGAHDTLTAVKAENKQQLIRYLLEKMDALQGDTRHPLQRSDEVAVRFFGSCIERLAGKGVSRLHLNVEDATLRTYADELRRISDWPVLNTNWVAAAANDSFSWGIHLSAELRSYGVQALWRLLVTSNWQQAEQQIFYISAPAFDLLKPTRNALQYDSDSEYMYKRYVKYLMMDLGVRVRAAQAIATEVIEFEKQLFELAANERLVLLRAPQTLATLQAQVPELNLSEYFKKVLRDVADKLPVDYEERLLIVADVPYLRKLSALLGHTKPELLGKYVLVQFLAHFEVNLHNELSYKEQHEHCLQQLHTFLPTELTEIFMRLQHADDGGIDAYIAHTQFALSDIFAQLKLQFERVLNTTNVFERDAQAKVLGFEKLRAMRLLLPQASTFSEHHLPPGVQLNDNYDANLMNLWRWRARKQLDEILETLLIGGSAKPAYNNYGPLDVNAYYRLKKNAIELPVGILRAPFYHSCIDPAKIYGSFVYIIAHELMHGFDYDGLNYDKSGNIAGNWGAKAIIRFGTKSRCYLTERYEGGEMALNENIADTEGLRLALESYRRAIGENATLTREQKRLFFLSFAQTWCGTGASTVNGLHSEHSVRVNNVLGNFQEFAQVYRCEANSQMNPKHKCSVW